MKLEPLKIKRRIMEIGLKTGCSHVASAMSCVNLLCDIYNKWPNEIIVLSKAHGALALYVILNEFGKLPDEILDTYYQDGGLSVHATLDRDHGIYASCGSLGHGLGIGVGYALANPKSPVIVVLSDGELDEGSTMEAFKIIKKLRIKNILPIVDRNDCQGFDKCVGYLEPSFREYYSIKGEGWGDLEGKFESHYKTVNRGLYDLWSQNSAAIEQNREKTIKEFNSLKKKNGKDKNR